MDLSIEIAIACDSNYIVPTTVLLQSIFDNNRNNKITLNLLYLNSSTKENDVEWLKNFTVNHGQSFRPLPVTEQTLSVFPVLRHGKSTYLRLLLPEIMPLSVNKVLYLDADIIVTGDLNFLYKEDVTHYYAAAVKETTEVYYRDLMTAMGIKDGVSFFGAGVMLMNLDKMRQDKVLLKYFEFATEHPDLIRCSDQDILNAVLWSDIKYVQPKYNFNFFAEKDVALKIWDADEIAEARKNPIIVHFIGKIKPWSYISFHPKTKLWWYYLKKTPFRDYEPNDKNLKNFFLKIYLFCFRRLEMLLTLKQKQLIGKLIPSVIKRIYKKSALKSTEL